MKKIFIYIFLMFSILFTFQNNKISAKSDLDYIQNYTVTVTPREDGTLYISVYLKWQVLDSKSEGPLTWIKYGVPNCYVDEFSKDTNNIEKLSYMNEDSAAYIRIDLDKAYQAGSVIDIGFSYHLSRMYFLSENQCLYHFIPGWFTDIKIGTMTVKWKADNVIESNFTNIESGYYVYRKSNLDYKETIEVKMTYLQESFIGLSEKEQYSDEYMPLHERIMLYCFLGVFFLVFIVIIIFSIIQYSKRDRYMEHRGFVRVRYHYHGHYHRHYRRNSGVDRNGHVIVNPSSGGSGHSSGGSCACACACACAGGGRAGCSRKDFYNTNIEVKKIIENTK